MNHLVCVHNLVDKLASLGIIHAPDILDTLVVCSLELFKTLLQLDKLVGEDLVLFGVVLILNLGLCKLISVQIHLVSESLIVFLKLGSESLLLLKVNLLSFIEHFIVEAKLFLIELVDGLHVFHALFEDLHLSLELDLLLSLLVGILAHDLLKSLGILFLFLLSLAKVHDLNSFVLVKKLIDFFLVILDNLSSFAVKFGFNVLQLLIVVISHFHELALHVHDQRVDIIRHTSDRLDVVRVFLIDLALKLFDKLLFVRNNLSTSSFLGLDVLHKITTVTKIN